MICPKLGCNAEMEGDDDRGYWCPKCEEYYPLDIWMQYLEENDPEAFRDSDKTGEET